MLLADFSYTFDFKNTSIVMLGIHPEAQGMALMQSSPLEAAHCTLALTFKGVHSEDIFSSKVSHLLSSSQKKLSF